MASAKRVLLTQWVSAVKQSVEYYQGKKAPDSNVVPESTQRLYRITLALTNKLLRGWVDEALADMKWYIGLWQGCNKQQFMRMKLIEVMEGNEVKIELSDSLSTVLNDFLRVI